MLKLRPVPPSGAWALLQQLQPEEICDTFLFCVIFFWGGGRRYSLICNIGATLVQAIQTLVNYRQIRSRAKDMKKEQDREKERVTEGQ